MKNARNAILFAIAASLMCPALARADQVRPAGDMLARDMVVERIFLELAGHTHGFTGDEEWTLANTVYDAAAAHDVDPFLVLAVIRVESTFTRGSRSCVGALGLMQVRPVTGRAYAHKAGVRWHGRHTLLHPASNIKIGTAYLARLLERFHGNTVLALTAYNHGPTAVRSMLRHHRRFDRDTLRYARKVRSIWRRYRAGLPAGRPVS